MSGSPSLRWTRPQKPYDRPAQKTKRTVSLYVALGVVVTDVVEVLRAWAVCVSKPSIRFKVLGAVFAYRGELLRNLWTKHAGLGR